MTQRLLTLALLTLHAGLADAQAGFPIVTDRPSFSDGTGTVPLGRWQLESGYTFFRSGGSEVQTFGEILLRVPLSDRFELRASNLSLARANAAGGGAEGLLDPVFGFKYRFQTGQPGKSPDWAVVWQTTVPAGQRDLWVGRSQPTAKLAGYFQATPIDGFGWNLALSSLGKDDTEFTQWAVSAYWARTLSPRAGAFV